jgi:uncharacterized protein YcbK (DUF882 family)
VNELLEKRIDMFTAPDFRWREALYLPRWEIYAVPPKEVRQRILEFAPKVQKARNILGVPMLVMSWWRPKVYNPLVGGAPGSAHKEGGALDFIARGIGCDQVIEILYPHLEELGLRMEDKPKSNWVHLDDRYPGPSGRFFKP